MSHGSSTSQQRQPRLRASCDGCFLAKIKCSKERPICQRCLTCGTDCKYSPSSRAGKPRSEGSRRNHNLDMRSQSHPAWISDDSTSLFTHGTHLPMSSPPNEHRIFDTSSSWPVPCEASQGSMGYPILPSAISIEALERQSNISNGGQQYDVAFEPSVVWFETTPPDTIDESSMEVRYTASAMTAPTKVLPSSNIAPWFRGFTRLSTSPTIDYSIATPQSSESGNETSVKHPLNTCNCLTTCLQAVQALHSPITSYRNATYTETIISMNQKAVQACAMMLDCKSCASSSVLASHDHRPFSLLAIIIEKVMALYRTISCGPDEAHEDLPSCRESNTRSEDELVSRHIDVVKKEIRIIEELLYRLGHLGADDMETLPVKLSSTTHSVFSIPLRESLWQTIRHFNLDHSHFPLLGAFQRENERMRSME